MSTTPTQTPTGRTHTPGPWTIGSSNEVIGDSDGGEAFSEWLTVEGPKGEIVCELHGHSQYARDTELSRREDANAALIAAAPDLKSALEALVYHFSDDTDPRWIAATAALRRAQPHA